MFRADRSDPDGPCSSAARAGRKTKSAARHIDKSWL